MTAAAAAVVVNRRPRRDDIQEEKAHTVLTSTACEATPGAILLEKHGLSGMQRGVSAERNRAVARGKEERRGVALYY